MKQSACEETFDDVLRFTVKEFTRSGNNQSLSAKLNVLRAFEYNSILSFEDVQTIIENHFEIKYPQAKTEKLLLKHIPCVIFQCPFVPYLKLKRDAIIQTKKFVVITSKPTSNNQYGLQIISFLLEALVKYNHHSNVWIESLIQFCSHNVQLSRCIGNQWTVIVIKKILGLSRVLCRFFGVMILARALENSDFGKQNGV